MPLSGRSSRGAQDVLTQILARDFLEEQQAAQAEARAQEQAAQAARDAESTRRFEVQQAGETADRTARTERERVLAANLQRQIDRENAADRDKANTKGVRRMLGEFVGREGAPRSADARAQLQGMAMQEDVDLPASLLKPSPEEEATARETARKESFEDFTKRADYQENQQRTRPERPTRTDLTPGQKLQYTRQLRNDYTRETASAREISRQFDTMKSGMDAARKGDLAAGSQAVLVTFQKILDPTSVVRESEYARSAAGQALLSRIQGAFDRVKSGGAGVPLNELQAFERLADSFMQNAAKSAREVQTQINAIAEEFGLDPNLITREYGDQPESSSGGSAYERYLARQKGGG